MKRLSALVVSVAMLIGAAGSASAATEVVDFDTDIVHGGVQVTYGQTYEIRGCWDGSGATYLTVKDGSSWRRVAKGRVSKSSNYCNRTNPDLHVYKWRVNRLPEANASGARYAQVALWSTGWKSKPYRVEVTQSVSSPRPPNPSASPTPVADTIPSEPTYVAAKPATVRGELSIVWQPPAVQGTSALTYEVRVNGNTVKSGITEPTYTVTGLSDATTYSVSVYALNASGQSQPTTISATTMARPLTPEEQEALAHPGQKKVTISVSAPGAVVGSRSNEYGGFDKFDGSNNPSWTFWVKTPALISVNFYRDHFAYAPGQAPTGNVSCEVTANGQVVTRSTGDYLFGVTSCSGYVR